MRYPSSINASHSPSSVPRIAAAVCAVLEGEVRALAPEIPQLKHIEVLPQGLHNTPALLREQLQQAVNRIEAAAEVDAIVLVYGLCCRGTEGVRADRCALVIPRAHDCITLLLGSKERYAEYVKDHPGTYWYSPGWIAHHTPPGQERYEKVRQEYIQKFGEDNADYLMEAEHHWYQTYNRAVYVDLGIAGTPRDVQYTRACADWLKWNFDQQHGDIALLRDLLAGPWDEERFLVLKPGESFRMTADERIIERVTNEE